MTIIIKIKRNDYGCVCMPTSTSFLSYVNSCIPCDLERLLSLPLSLSPSLSSHQYNRIFFSSVSISYSFLLWCTTTIIGEWQQTTTTRAIRRRHRRWFRRLIIIALSRPGLSFLRSSTFLLLPSSHRFNRSQCSERTSNTTATTSPSFDIHNSYQFLHFSFKTKTARQYILELKQCGIST